MSGEDDLLARSTRALRAEPPPSEQELTAGKGALLWAHRGAQAKRRRGRTLRWVLPLAAMLAAGSALAHTTGQLERMAVVVSELLGVERDPEPAPAKRARLAPKAPAPKPTRPTPAVVPVATPALPVAEPAVEPAVEASVQAEMPTQPHQNDASALALPSTPVARPRKAARLEPAPPATSESTAPSPEPGEYVREGAADEPEAAAPAPIPSGDLARYREAHRAHFQTRDFAAALRGWDTYLAEYASGTFAIEAQYNRAICLVRLGRKDEARRALAPFAGGQVARGYRKGEANKLLEALE